MALGGTVSRIEEVRKILQELIQKPLNIQCIFLISSQGQPITVPMGAGRHDAASMARIMPYLTQSTSVELQWTDVNKVCIQGKNGYVLLARCTPGASLLVQAGRTLLGLLDGEINRAAQRLQTILLDGWFVDDSVSEVLNTNALIDSLPQARATPREDVLVLGSSKRSHVPPERAAALESPILLKPDFIDQCEQKLAFYIGPIARIVVAKTLNEADYKTPKQFIERLGENIPSPMLAQKFNGEF